MSASREKKTRQDGTTQGPTSREQKKQQEAQEARRTTVLYTVVGVVCAALAIFLIVWNTGLIQRNATAVTINGTKYQAADVQYYFTTARTSILNTYAQYGMTPFNYNTSTKGQVYDSKTGETWFDYLMDQALDTMARTAALADKANAEGYTLSAAAQDTLDSYLSDLDSRWSEYGYSSQEKFIQNNYGSDMTYDRLVKLITQDLLASDYANYTGESFTYSDAEYQSYYQEHADELDAFTLTQFVFQARAAATDAEGNAIEMTDEEKAAALEEAKAQSKAAAEAFQARLEAGEDPEALKEEYADDLYSSSISEVRTGSSVNTAYSEWMYDSARRSGDITLAEYDSTTAYNYYVVRFEGRQRDDTPTADVRHILIAPETDEGATEATEEQIADAKAKAEELLSQWEAGEATEDSFAALARENSSDTGSASTGGLITGITPTSSYVESFRDWAVDSARKSGDTGLVQSTYGWHIMYFVGDGDPTWKLTADNALRSADYEQWQNAATVGYTASTGLGIKFVQG